MEKESKKQVINPYAHIKVRKDRQPSIKYCAWEVLKDSQEGLAVSAIVKEIEAKGLRQFTSLNNPSKLVFTKLTNQKEHFSYNPKTEVWSIKWTGQSNPEVTESDKPISKPIKKPSPVAKGSTSSTKAKTKELSLVVKEGRSSELKEVTKLKEASPSEIKTKEKGKKMDKKAFSSSSSSKEKISTKRRSHEGTQSPRRTKKLKGESLIGVPVKVWWPGEHQYFPGTIKAYNKESGRYRILYEDGDSDNDLEMQKYDIYMKGTEIDHILIDKHNLENVDDEKDVLAEEDEEKEADNKP